MEFSENDFESGGFYFAFNYLVKDIPFVGGALRNPL